MGFGIFLHFAKRDARDLYVGWIGIALSFLVLFSGGFHKQSAIWVSAYFFLFFLIAYLGQVWGESGAWHGVPRSYLLALPVARKRMFAFCMARAFVGAMPLGGLGLFFAFGAVPFPRSLYLDVRQFGLGQRLGFSVFVLVSLFFLCIVLSNSTWLAEELRKLTGRFNRMLTLLRAFGLMFVDVCFMGAWVIPVLTLFFDLQFASSGAAGLAVFALPYFGWRMKRNYRRWVND